MKIFATRRIPSAGLEILERAGRVAVAQDAEDEVVPRAKVLEGVKDADILVSLLTERIDGEIMRAGTRLRGVANYAVGYNNIDVEAATELGLPVTNTPGVLTDTTADLAWTLIMAVARNVVSADRYMRAGRYKIWGPSLFLGADVSRGGDGRQKVLGIVGFGRIGQAVLRRASGFDMRCLAHDPPMQSIIERTEGVEYAELDRLLELSDFVSIHTDLNPSTKHLFGAEAFEKMKTTAILINTARGPIVDEKALVAALRDGKIAGAGLDVFEDEPLMAPGLAELDNVVVLPHIASASRDTRNKMATMCAENAVAHIKLERAPNCVNPEVYHSEAYRKRIARSRR
ncbi:MAG TPA: D-glycerate dehydrogenase [Vicinamibacteria bacterium]|nr:D-glycerate dehydrogenase [Vicinamibacteria bacterium]